MSRQGAILIILIVLLTATLVLGVENNYRIGPGDVLHIMVYDEPDLERTVTVQEDGNIRFPLVRTLNIGGKTVQEAARDLETALGESYLVAPQVSITVREFHARMVYVLGAVRNPGLYPLSGGTITVLEIITQAGGVTEEGSHRMLLLRGGGNPARVKRLLEQQNASQGGEETLRDAGLHPPIIIDGQALLDEGDTSQNQVLQAGDVLYVPKMKKVYVLGEVRRPGAVPFSEGLTLLQAISLAGGTTEMASDSIHVTRRVDGTEKRFKLKYKKILRDTNLDLHLEPNDVIVVKRRIL